MKKYSVLQKQSFTSSEVVSNEKISEFIDDTIKEIGNGFIVCWLYHKVLTASIVSSKVIHPDEVPDYEHQLVRIRIFNPEKEWHIWKSGSHFQVRFREETSQQDPTTDFVDRELVLWGTRSQLYNDSFQELTEDRGTGLLLPISAGTLAGKNARFVLNTRNYIGYNDIGQAGYVDSRFLDIQVKKF